MTATVSILERIKDTVHHSRRTVPPGRLAWKGAALGLLLVTLGFLLITAFTFFQAPPRIISVLLGSARYIGMGALVGALIVSLLALLKRIPAFFGWALVFALVLLFASFQNSLGAASRTGLLIFWLEISAVASLLGAAVWVLARGGWRQANSVQRVITLLALALGLAGLAFGAKWLLASGPAVASPPNAAAMSAAQVTPLNLPDPSQTGPYEVQALVYGSGQDRQRLEYREVDLVTGSVDGSPFTSGWSSARTSYWGFGPEALPINGRVWYPGGDGPFPLVLIVHGDHVMTESSDPGYGYLGELLASRGFILASIDANFLNYAVPEGLPGEENDARGWLMLEHLRFWKAWNETPGNPFFQKVDMKDIAVMGHSRGGEAASIAAAFNRLPYYPDDATVAFDYNFNIRSVVAIAPVFETYQPRGRNLPLENVNYFVLQGSNDSQILSFMGLSQYSRVAFTDDQSWFKAALYIYGSNHGGFNTVWVTDQMGPAAWLFNQQAVMPSEDQQHIAEVYISAFLEATLRSKTGYIPLFGDARLSPGWLPDTIILSQFQQSTDQLVSTYEEDMNAATTTMPGGIQSGQNLAVWREQAVRLIASIVTGPIDNTAVFLGWNAGAPAGPASYSIRLPDGLAVDASSTLSFSMADADEDPTPGMADGKAASGPVDLTVEVVDRAGHAVRLPLSSFSYLQPQIVMTLMKAPSMNIAGPSPSEPVFQSFEFPLAAFVAEDPAFDPASLAAVRFIFDRTPAGVIVLDDVGFRK